MRQMNIGEIWNIELQSLKLDEKKDTFTLINPMFLDLNIQLENNGRSYFHPVIDWYANLSLKDWKSVLTMVCPQLVNDIKAVYEMNC